MKDAKDSTDVSRVGTRADSAEVLMSTVRGEMREDLGRALAEDRTSFNRKFDAVQTKLTEMKDAIVHSTDRLMVAIGAGAHDRILDKVRSARCSVSACRHVLAQDLHSVWEDMVLRNGMCAQPLTYVARAGRAA